MQYSSCYLLAVIIVKSDKFLTPMDSQKKKVKKRSKSVKCKLIKRFQEHV